MAIKTAKRRCAKVAMAAIAITMAATLSSSTLSAFANTGDGLSTTKKYGSDYSSFDEVLEAGRDLNLELAAEGFVLMKNRNNALPISTNAASKAKVTVLGETADTLAYGGAGSGAQSRPGSGRSNVASQTQSTIFDSLEAANFEVNTQVKALYETDALAPKGRAGGFGSAGDAQYNGVEYMTVCGEGENGTVSFGGLNYKAAATDPLESAKSTFAQYDTALVVLSRSGAENADNKTHNVNGNKDVNKHYLELNDSEASLFAYAKANFNKVIAIINSPAAMELGCLENDDDIDATIWIGQPGWNGIMALGKVLNGEVNPSGKLVDFYMADFTTDPTWYNFGNYTQAQYALTGAYGDSKGTVVMGTDANGSLTNTQEKAIDYAEGIYVGYRYYETVYAELLAATDKATADAWWEENVVYPFGHGLSYTTFSQDIKEIKGDLSEANKDGKVTVTVTVTNTGSVAGKEVVQLYSSAPYTAGGIEKAAVDLIGFGKTDLLAPNASEDVEIEVLVKDLSAFDYNDANTNEHYGYELDAGSYDISIRKDSHSVIDSKTRTVATTINWESDDDASTPNNIFSQGDNEDKSSQWAAFNTNASAWTVSGEDHNLTRDKLVSANGELYDLKQLAWLLTDDNEFIDETFAVQNSLRTVAGGGLLYNGVEKDWDNAATTEAETDYKNLWTKEASDIPDSWTQSTTVPANGHAIKLYSMLGVPYDDAKWDEFINQLTWDELKTLTLDSGYKNPELDSINKPYIEDADGPGQLSGGWAWVCEVVIASTWNTELAEEQGNIVGNESMWLGRNGWYGPGANNHRNPLGGRNFEYYSQDGLQGGKIAAAVTKGATDMGCHVYMKHSFLNEQETTRQSTVTFVNEQALRQIYARPFEISVKEGNLNGMMTSFNRIGIESSANYAVNVQMYSNEWGYDGMTITDAYDSGPASGWSSYEMSRGLITPLSNRMGQKAEDINATWDATARDGKGVLTIQVNGESKPTYTQWYWTRETAKRELFTTVNGSGMKNGIIISEMLYSTDVDVSIGDSVNAKIVNVAAANRAFGNGNYTVTVTGLPEGLRYDEARGAIVGTTTAAHMGTVSVTLNGGAGSEWISGSTSFTLYVHPFAALTVGLAVENKEYTADLTATFLTEDNFTPNLALTGDFNSWFALIGKYSGKAVTQGSGWSATTVGGEKVVFTLAEGATLPEGLTFNAETGTISGTPTKAGTYQFDVMMEYSQVQEGAGSWGLPGIRAISINETVTLTVLDHEPNAVEIINGTWWINGEDTGIRVQGNAGLDGIDGVDGADGVGVLSAVINGDGELVITLTNGNEINVGKVVGANGADGADGTNGTNGVDGINGINGTNGTNGKDGKDGGSGLAIAGLVLGALGLAAAGGAVAFVFVSKKKNG